MMVLAVPKVLDVPKVLEVHKVLKVQSTPSTSCARCIASARGKPANSPQ